MQESFTYFYIPPPLVTDNQLVFPEEESRHIKTVCRKRAGEEIYAVDGLGNRYHVRLLDTSAERVVGQVLTSEIDINEPRMKLSLALPWTKNPKLDFVIARATELGVSKFIYYAADRAVIRNDEEDTAKKQERHKRISISAIKQSLRCTLPEMQDIGASHNFEKVIQFYDVSLYADLNREALPLATALQGRMPKWLLLVIGPEAGLSKDEKIVLESSGALPISLGPRRLRFETAAIAFAACALGLLGELE